MSTDIDKELPGFNVRTQVDDLVGKLIYIRDRQYDTPALDILAALDDADEIIERALESVVDFPTDVFPEAESGSKCYVEACSCGMPTWAACERSDR